MCGTASGAWLIEGQRAAERQAHRPDVRMERSGRRDSHPQVFHAQVLAQLARRMTLLPTSGRVGRWGRVSFYSGRHLVRSDGEQELSSLDGRTFLLPKPVPSGAIHRALDESEGQFCDCEAQEEHERPGDPQLDSGNERGNEYGERPVVQVEPV